MPHIRVASGLELYYRDAGAGPPILWIMGLGSSGRDWALSAPAFEDGFRCITYDNRDAGQSQRAKAPYGVADMIEDAVGLLDALDIERAHVVGFSMGGAQAQELAIRHPERVDKLVLVCTYTSGDPRGTAIFRGQAFLRERLSREEYQRVTLPYVYSWRDYQRPGFIDATIQSILSEEQQPLDAYRRQVEATTTVHTEDRLDRIAASTLLVFGSDDVLTPMRFARTLEAGIADARLHVVDGAGHGLPWSHAEELNAAIRGFWGEGEQS